MVIIMALILIRGETISKIVNSIKSLEIQGNFSLSNNPVVIDPVVADSIVERILNSKIRTKSNFAVAFFVREGDSSSIVKIKNIRPPAHVVVISEKYDSYSQLNRLIRTGNVFTHYKTCRLVNNGMIDYSIVEKERRVIKNGKVNSYLK